MTEPIPGGASADDLLAWLGQRSVHGPVSLHLLLADRCNHACQHCYQVQGRKGELDLEQVTHVLRDFREAGGFVLAVSGGEATLRADLTDILGFARSLGLVTVLYTNGYSMTPELAARLAEVGVWRVEVSLYSDVAAEHDAITLVPGSWERTMRGIRALRDARLNVRIKVTPMKGVTVTLERMEALARAFDASVSVGAQLMPKENGDHATLALRLEGETAALFGGGGAQGQTRAPCGAGLSALTMRSDGVVQPCINIPVELGNALSPDWVDASRRSEAAQLFRTLTWQSLHGCRDCDLQSFCSRCHACAGAEMGDLFGPYPGACSLAVARYRRTRPICELMSPSPDCAPERQSAVGPYRVEAAGLRPVPDRVSEEDEALAAKFAWIRPGRGEAPQPRRSGLGLVKLRRNRGDGGLDGRRTST